MPPDGEEPESLAEALDQLAVRIAAASSFLRDLLAREALFERHGHVRWQLLTVLNSLGLHEGTVRELRRFAGRGSEPA